LLLRIGQWQSLEIPGVVGIEAKSLLFGCKGLSSYPRKSAVASFLAGATIFHTWTAKDMKLISG
jgi:hypothetical protein